MTEPLTKFSFTDCATVPPWPPENPVIKPQHCWSATTSKSLNSIDLSTMHPTSNYLLQAMQALTLKRQCWLDHCRSSWSDCGSSNPLRPCVSNQLSLKPSWPQLVRHRGPRDVTEEGDSLIRPYLNDAQTPNSIVLNSTDLYVWPTSRMNQDGRRLSDETASSNVVCLGGQTGVTFAIPLKHCHNESKLGQPGMHCKQHCPQHVSNQPLPFRNTVWLTAAWTEQPKHHCRDWPKRVHCAMTWTKWHKTLHDTTATHCLLLRGTLDVGLN